MNEPSTPAIDPQKEHAPSGPGDAAAKSPEKLACSSVTPAGHSQRWALWLIVIMVIAKLLVEHTGPCQRAEEATYNFLQHLLYVTGGREQPRAVVVDLAAVPKEHWEEDGQTGSATSRKTLKEFIQAIAEAGASAIGVDVDFSPEPDPEHPGQLKFIHPRDAEFFDWCLQLHNREPGFHISLGVFRRRHDSQHWLMNSNYMSLAALIAHSRREPRKVIHFLQSDLDGWPLPSMSASLAGVGRVFRMHQPEPLDGLFESYTVESGADSVQASIMDPRSLRRLRDDTIYPLKASVFTDSPRLVEKRIVVLGDAKPMDPKEYFEIEGLEPMPGVYLHAAGVETLLNRPLRRFTFGGRLLVDAVLSLLIYFTGRLLGLVGHRGSDAHAERPHLFVHAALTLLAILLILLVSTVLITFTRLLWTDFLLVCLFLVLHWLVEALTPWCRDHGWPFLCKLLRPRKAQSSA